ncbi:MAG: sugar transferase [Candidatus Hydrogenedentes bacterium]|nr:sugar transferase [Candidatus Hydrogenedentota bacterium]
MVTAQESHNLLERAVRVPERDAGLALVWRHRGTILYFCDAAGIGAAFVLAYCLRFYAPFVALREAPVVPGIGPYLSAACIFGGVWTFLIWLNNGYENKLLSINEPAVQLRNIVLAGLQAFLVLMALSFLIRQLLLSRQVYVMAWFGALVAVVLVRALFRQVDRVTASRGRVAERVAVVGPAAYAGDIDTQFRLAGLPLRVTGTVRWAPPVDADGAPGASADAAGIPCLGDVARIAEVHAASPFEKLVIVFDRTTSRQEDTEQDALIGIVNFCEERNIPVYMLPSVADIAVIESEIGSFRGMPLFHLRDASLHPGYAAVRRLFDIVVSSLSLGLGMPVWLFIAWLIKRTDGGSVLYTQMRVGLHGKPYPMYKFRSMVQDADGRLQELVGDFDSMAEPVFNIRRDPRITRIGRFLRRTSLDEIPQLINVLKGEMSLIGPRPERVELVERYNPWQRRRLKAKPGITGYQQVVSRGDPSLERRIQYDLYYLKYQGPWLDLWILLMTFVVVIRGDGTS